MPQKLIRTIQPETTHDSWKSKEEAFDKSTLLNCNLVSMAIGRSHIVWGKVENNTVDVERGITKAQMLVNMCLYGAVDEREIQPVRGRADFPLCMLATVTEDLKTTHVIEMPVSLSCFYLPSECSSSNGLVYPDSTNSPVRCSTDWL